MSSPAAPKPPVGRRFAIALVIAGVTVAPALIMFAVAYVGTGQAQGAATWASLPAVAGIAAAVTQGRRFAIVVAIVMGLAAPLAIVAGMSPVSGAALMAVLCMVVGRLSRFGLHKSGLLVPVMLAWPLIDPPAWDGQSTVDRLDTPYLLWMAGTFFVGGLFAALVVPFLMRKRRLPTRQPQVLAQAEAVTYTVMITVLVAVATFYVLDTPTAYGGAFLIAAILVLAPLGHAQTLRPTVVRVVATIAGSVIVLAIVSRVESLAVIYLVGLVLIVIALAARLGPRGWVYYVLMMPATACLNATSLAQVGQLGEQRAIDNVIGGALVLAASAVTVVYSNWADRHGHAVDGDMETAHLQGSGGARTDGS